MKIVICISGYCYGSFCYVTCNIGIVCCKTMTIAIPTSVKNKVLEEFPTPSKPPVVPRPTLCVAIPIRSFEILPTKTC